jgi:hypothetical protein
METFPEVPDNEIGDFLMNCTAFPMAEPATILVQLQELRAQTADYKACYGIVEAEMDALSAAQALGAAQYTP